MPVLKNFLFRTLVKSLVIPSFVYDPDEDYVELTAGSLVVKSTLGGTTTLDFEEMLLIDYAKAKEMAEGSDFLTTLCLLWPEEIARLRDGLTLCEATQAIREYDIALGLFQFGEINRWWSLEYDPNTTCEHAEEHPDFEHCTLRLSQFNVPPRRPRKRREYKFALPTLTIAKPGYAFG